MEGKRGRLRLLEKGGKEKLVWLHREAEEFLDAYIAAANIVDPEAALFQTLDKAHRLTGQALDRRNMLRAVKERCAKAGLIGGVLQSHLPGHRHDGVSAQRRIA